MRNTETVLICIAALLLPAAASAQAPRVSARVRAEARVSDVLNQQQRPRTRVIVQTREGREEQSETLQRTVRVGSNGELHIANLAGNIELKRGGGSDMVIDIVKVARGRTADEAREMLPQVRIDITERANRAEVRTIYQGDQQGPRRHINVQVHYTITAPAGTRVTARSLSGSIRAADITGELSLVTTSGNVQVVRAKRVSAAKSTSGRVEISDTESDMPLEAGSVSGDVVVHKVKASQLELSTISGKVVVQDVASDRIEARSMSGDVEFGGQFAKGGRYAFNSHAGNVRIAVGGGTGFSVEANSWSGDVQSEVAMTGGLQQASGRGPRRKELRGVVGDGSATVEITTFSGNVLITRR